MYLVSLSLLDLDPNNFYVGFFSLSLVSQKLVGQRFPQLHGTNTYRRVVSLGLESPTKYVPRFPFPQPGFSKTCWGTFPSASWHQHVEKSRFTWPWEPNQVCASFPSAFWTQTNFDLGLLSLSLVSQKLLGVRFPQLHSTNM